MASVASESGEWRRMQKRTTAKRACPNDELEDAALLLAMSSAHRGSGAYSMPASHASSHFRECRLSLLTQEAQMQDLVDELSWVSSITQKGTKFVLHFDASASIEASASALADANFGKDLGIDLQIHISDGKQVWRVVCDHKYLAAAAAAHALPSARSPRAIGGGDSGSSKKGGNAAGGGGNGTGSGEVGGYLLGDAVTEIFDHIERALQNEPILGANGEAQGVYSVLIDREQGRIILGWHGKEIALPLQLEPGPTAVQELMKKYIPQLLNTIEKRRGCVTKIRKCLDQKSNDARKEAGALEKRAQEVQERRKTTLMKLLRLRRQKDAYTRLLQRESSAAMQDSSSAAMMMAAASSAH